MRLVYFVKITFFVTVLMVVYINMQMKIFDLAYAGKFKEQQIRTLIEDNGSETYRILKLKSANNLGVEMLTQNKDMQFVDPQNVIAIAASLQEDEAIQIGLQQQISTKDKWLSFLTSVKTAEATTKK